MVHGDAVRCVFFFWVRGWRFGLACEDGRLIRWVHKKSEHMCVPHPGSVVGCGVRRRRARAHVCGGVMGVRATGGGVDVDGSCVRQCLHGVRGSSTEGARDLVKEGQTWPLGFEAAGGYKFFYMM